MSSVVQIKKKGDFDQLKSSTPFVVIQASASWCGPCKAISPIFAKHADELAVKDSYAFAKFDTDEVPDLAFELGVRAMPTFFFFENGQKSDRNVTGAKPAVLKETVVEFAEKAKAKTKGTSFSTTEEF